MKLLSMVILIVESQTGAAEIKKLMADEVTGKPQLGVIVKVME